VLGDSHHKKSSRDGGARPVEGSESGNPPKGGEAHREEAFGQWRFKMGIVDSCEKKKNLRRRKEEGEDVSVPRSSTK